MTIKASCVAVVLENMHSKTDAMLIGHSTDKDSLKIWEEEIDNGCLIEDIFYNSYGDIPGEKAGYFVWEGTIKPIEDNAPFFKGKWRDATKEDMVELIKEA